MLQVAERSSGVKRKALLVATPPPTPEPDTIPDQRQFIGQPFDRMRADPELARVSRKLFFGVAAVAGLILIVTIWSLVEAWSSSSVEGSDSATTVEPVPVSVSIAPPAIEGQHLPPLLSRPMDFEQIVKKRQSEMTASMQEAGGE
ncbi:hypothetical protein EI77_00121 [Prosthecobacter fusiformis]|uniref:Uncharacterized protein n=2 Tax=Prosthecobacter fusiformis TaxID=48464 RepID=A0A4V6Q5P0_9BACT|nr:hypothetical protein EI77_00121 [Prosthecobacter fusiformis]